MLGLPEDARFIEVRNDATTDAPAFAVMKITGIVVDPDTKDLITTVDQPDEDSLCQVLFNGGVILTGSGGRGRATIDMPTLAAYDSTSGSPTLGTEMGTATGEWLLNVGKNRFLTEGVFDATNFIARVNVAPGQGEQATLIHFKLAAGLTTVAASTTATLVSGQFWGGSEPSTGAGALTVYNLETSSSGVFHWEGDIGDRGVGRKMDADDDFAIVEMECVGEQFTTEQVGRRSAVRTFAYG